MKHIFHMHDAVEILKIKPPAAEMDGFLAWHYEKSSLFTVRSAYKVALQEVATDRQAGACSSSSDGSRQLWNNNTTSGWRQYLRRFVSFHGDLQGRISYKKD